MSYNPITIIAPAKVNLFLHVVGKTENNYHDLQSLVAFADFGDTITITEDNKFSISFESTVKHLPTDENNLILCAAALIAQKLGKDLKCNIHLDKKIPIGAGLGGGSSDAAATVRGLLKFWNEKVTDDNLEPLLLDLGSDVPACYHGKTCYFEGTGDIIKPVSSFPPLNALLVYPNQHNATKEIFSLYCRSFSSKVELPEQFEDYFSIMNFLHDKRNDLTDAAIQKSPEIEDVLHSLGNQYQCQEARMSGSGSACYGLFKTKETAEKAAENIQDKHPDWWVQNVILK